MGFSKNSINPKKPQGIITYGLAFAMLGAHKLEKMNEMRDHSNCGTNTLCAYEHEWPLGSSAGFLENAKMNEYTQKLWVELDGAEEDGMFYLASPCKADLTVRKTTCQCKEYFDSDTVYSNIVIQPLVLHEGVDWYGDSDETLLEPYRVRVKFPKDENKDEFVHTFKFIPGESVTFTYMPEGSTPDEWEEVKLYDSSEVNDPIMLEQALRSMDKEDPVEWIEENSRIDAVKYSDSNSDGGYYRLEVIDRYENNYGQNTVYKSCVKGTWWKLGEPNDIDVDCIKIKAEGYVMVTISRISATRENGTKQA